MVGLCLGCQSFAQELPGILTHGSPKTHAILEATASKLLGGISVRLSADAFTTNSLVTVEHQSHRSMDGKPATSLLHRKPEQFMLMIRGRQCELVRMKTGARATISSIECQPLSLSAP